MKFRNRKAGEKRTRKIFALVPHLCTDGYWRWLEWLIVEEEFQFSWDGAEWYELKAYKA